MVRYISNSIVTHSIFILQTLGILAADAAIVYFLFLQPQPTSGTNHALVVLIAAAITMGWSVGISSTGYYASQSYLQRWWNAAGFNEMGKWTNIFFVISAVFGILPTGLWALFESYRSGWLIEVNYV